MKRKQNFTLLEMLVVIGLIALLAGLAFPAFNSAREKGRENAALAGCTTLATALSQFESTYSRFPLSSISDPVGGKNSTTATYDQILGILTGVTAGSTTDYSNWSTDNPKKVRFLQPDPQYTQANGSYLNPWKERYYIFFDTTGDAKMTFKRAKNGALVSNTVTVFAKVAVFSELNPGGNDYKNGTRLATSWGGIQKY